MSRNTQGGLGHRLRGRRGGNARHRHQLSSSGGGSRTGEMERREKKKKGANWVGRGFSLVTPQSSRARRMRRAEQETTREKNGNTAARVDKKEPLYYGIFFSCCCSHTPHWKSSFIFHSVDLDIIISFSETGKKGPSVSPSNLLHICAFCSGSSKFS